MCADTRTQSCWRATTHITARSVGRVWRRRGGCASRSRLTRSRFASSASFRWVSTLPEFSRTTVSYTFLKQLGPVDSSVLNAVGKRLHAWQTQKDWGHNRTQSQAGDDEACSWQQQFSDHPEGPLQVNGVPLKNSQMVEFGERLNLGPYMARGALDGAAATYGLYGIIVHEGMRNSPHSGHYVAFVRGTDGQWWECNDGQVGPHHLETCIWCTLLRDGTADFVDCVAAKKALS